MLHTNTRNINIYQCVCMYALPSHRLHALQYSTRTFYGLPPTVNVRSELQKHHGRSGEVRVWLGWEVRPPGPVTERLQFVSDQVLQETSGMDLEGEQLLRVHVVERAQVRQLQQELGKDGRLVRVVLGDEAPQGADQSLLQGLH